MTSTVVSGVRIDALPAATLPLVGDEVVPLMQDGVARQAPSSSFGGGSSAAFSLTGKLAVNLAAGNTDDWAPDLTDISRLEVTAAGAATVTGLVGGSDGLVIIVTNVGLNDVTLMAEDAGSTAANRFAMNGDALLLSGWSAMFIYSSALSRWTKLGL